MVTYIKICICILLTIRIIVRILDFIETLMSRINMAKKLSTPVDKSGSKMREDSSMTKRFDRNGKIKQEIGFKAN